MKMTTLNMTKEEMIYQFIISLNKGGYADDAYASDVVETAIGEYDALIEKDIIKEIAYVEPGKPTNDPRVLECKTVRGYKSVSDLDTNLAFYPSANEVNM